MLGLPAFRSAPFSDQFDRGLIVFFGVPLIWLGVVAANGFMQRVVELRADGIWTRRWLERWLGRPGRHVGRPEAVTATRTPRSLRIAAPDRQVTIVLVLWAPSARADVDELLSIWGVTPHIRRRHCLMPSHPPADHQSPAGRDAPG